MEKIDFDKVYDDLEKIKNKIVKEYIEIYNSRSNDEKIGVYNSTIIWMMFAVALVSILEIDAAASLSNTKNIS